MSEKNLKSLRFHGLDDIYKIPSTAEDVGAATLEQVNQAMRKAAPRNLLDNSDFRNPVNQRGKDVYSNAEYTIDRWKSDIGGIDVSVEDGCVSLFSSGAYNFTQLVGDYKSLRGKAATFALRYDGDITLVIGYYANGAMQYKNAKSVNGLAIGTIVVPDNAQSITFFIQTKVSIKASLYWAVLYEGEYTINTLPEYQPKGYENELLVCRQYDPTTGEYIGLRKFSQPRNLLDNSDFTNPVNQRGVTDGKITNAFWIDRWKILNVGRVTFGNGYITITADQGYDAYLRQYFEKLPKFPATIRLETTSGVISVTLKGTERITFNDNMYFEISSNKYITVFIPQNKSLSIVNIALYEGEYTVDTLPDYQPKGYSAELLECMRYYQQSFTDNPQNPVNSQIVFGANPNWISTVKFPVPMRVRPEVVLYNNVTGNADEVCIWKNDEAVSDVFANTVGTDGFNPYKPGGLVENLAYGLHYTADAELD